MTRSKFMVRSTMLKVFTCTDHDSHWVGTASVIVAKDKGAARRLLNKELLKRGLDPKDPKYTLTEISLEKNAAYVIA